MNVHVVAYRPDGQDSCRGCVRDSWGSEFESERFQTPEQAAEFVAKKMLEDSLKNERQPDWEFTVVFAKYDQWDDDAVRVEDEAEENFHKLEALAFSRAKAEHERVVAENTRKLQASRERLANTQAEKDKEARRAMFQQLKKEFGQ